MFSIAEAQKDEEQKFIRQVFLFLYHPSFFFYVEENTLFKLIHVFR